MILPLSICKELEKLCYYQQQDFFWAEDAALLRWTRSILARVNQLDAVVQREFWDGKLPRSLFKKLGFQGAEPAEKFLRRIPANKLVVLCRIRRSCDHAWDRLMVRAAGVKPSDGGEIFMGGVRVSEKSYVLKWAATAKQIDRVGMSDTLGPAVLKRAKRQHDLQFLKAYNRAIALGKKRSDKIPAEIDWSKIRDLHQFLVEAWCEWPRPYERLPPICLFTGKARSAFCSMLLGVKDNKSLNDAIRQDVHELGLWRPRKGLRISAVEFQGGFVRFV